MLKMGGNTSILGYRCPTVRKNFCLVSARRDHRLDRENEPRPQHPSLHRFSEVRHLRRLVHGPPDPVTHELPDDSEAVRLDPRLDRRRDVPDAVSGAALFDRVGERQLRDLQELLRPRRDLDLKNPRSRGVLVCECGK